MVYDYVCTFYLKKGSILNQEVAIATAAPMAIPGGNETRAHVS
jgi:hypothetical protein